MMARLLTVLLSLVLCLGWNSAAFSIQEITGAPVKVSLIASGVTTNTTTLLLKVPAGYKSLYGEVICSAGACTQTQKLYGTAYSTAINGILLCTITLSGTPRHEDACPPFTANFFNYYLVTTNTTGTGATGAVYAMY